MQMPFENTVIDRVENQGNTVRRLSMSSPDLLDKHLKE